MRPKRNSSSPTPSYLADWWHPKTTYTATMPQIAAWFMKHGESAMSEGDKWTLKRKKLCPGVYKVWFDLC